MKIKQVVGMTLTSLAVAVFLSACGDSVKEMSDTQLKDTNYYRANKEEMVEKSKWCIEKSGVLEKEKARARMEDKVTGSIAKRDIVLDLIKGSGKLSEIDVQNCSNALYIYFDEYKK